MNKMTMYFREIKQQFGTNFGSCSILVDTLALFKSCEVNFSICTCLSIPIDFLDKIKTV